MKLDLSAEGWGRVIAYTVLGTAVCVGAALYVDSFNFSAMTGEQRLRAVLIDVTLPTMLAVPLLLFFAGKLRELAIANRQLTIYASTDSLTQIMNRAAFTGMVDAYLEDARRDGTAGGALLIVDADNFKSINDRFGHDRGDEALVLMAHALRDELRLPDLVGRLGGEEFGIFLPGANAERATAVGERLRQAVNDVPFHPAGVPHRLSVSVGGTVFARPIGFSALFHLADGQLYAAEHAGRNRVAIGTVGPSALAA